MVFLLTWLASELETAGLKVAEVPGWEDRGRAEMGPVKGIICHHTAGPKSGNMPSLRIIKDGRSDLPGPLAQLGLGRDGTFYVVAAGRANHAGAGSWRGFTNGNQNFIGIEAENSGTSDDIWPAIQMDAYHRGVAAILRRIGAPASMCCGHREYALPTGRKTDPLFDIDQFRADVNIIMGGGNPPMLIPAVDDQSRPTIRRGVQGTLVEQLQRKLGMTAIDGNFGPNTEAAVRAFQALKGLVPDGIVGPKTWSASDG
jgi:peptidoglycan hydrolase-like protein with peptidoglycan-binding domain